MFINRITHKLRKFLKREFLSLGEIDSLLTNIGWAPVLLEIIFKVIQVLVNDKYVINYFLMFSQLAFNGPGKESGIT
jgi:hypothetical protein